MEEQEAMVGFLEKPFTSSTEMPLNWFLTLGFVGSRESTRTASGGSAACRALITAIPWAPVPPITSMVLAMLLRCDRSLLNTKVS